MGGDLKDNCTNLNNVPTKATPKIHYELWSGKKPSVSYMCTWGSLAEARPYKPQEKVFDPRTTSGFSIGYPKKSKGYRIYYPSRVPIIIETNKVKFLEDGGVSGSGSS